MTPKEKAEELVGKMIPHTRVFHGVLGWEDYQDSAKQCALIAVDEIINQYYTHTDNVTQHEYWQQVKQEINKL